MPTNATAKNTVRVRNHAQAVLLKDELLGQISDGHWENTPGTGWEQWCNAEVEVDPANVGRNFYARKDNFNLSAKQLLDVVGDRMIESVRGLGPDYANYDMKAMKADLADLKLIFKTYTAPTEADVTAGRLEAEAREQARLEAEAKRAAIVERVKELTGGYVSRGQYGRMEMSASTLEQLLDLIPSA
jgi:hypothetical protein